MNKMKKSIKNQNQYTRNKSKKNKKHIYNSNKKIYIENDRKKKIFHIGSSYVYDINITLEFFPILLAILTYIIISIIHIHDYVDKDVIIDRSNSVIESLTEQLSFVPHCRQFLSINESIDIDIVELVFPSLDRNLFPSLDRIQEGLTPWINNINLRMRPLVLDNQILQNIYPIAQRIYVFVSLVFIWGFIPWEYYLYFPSAWLIILNNMHRNKYIVTLIAGIFLTSHLYIDMNQQLLTYLRENEIFSVIDLTSYIDTITVNITTNFSGIEWLECLDDKSYMLQADNQKIVDFIVRIILSNIAYKLIISLNEFGQTGGSGVSNKSKLEYYKKFTLEQLKPELNKFSTINIKPYLLDIIQLNRYPDLLYEICTDSEFDCFIEMKIRNDTENELVKKEIKQFYEILQLCKS